MKKFQNKYRIPSARWQSWDYANPSMYFLTICTQGRVHFFGEIKNGEMFLNEMRQMAEICWAEIPAHFPNMELGAFVIMPNHLHGILILNERVIDCDVETLHATSLQPQYKFMSSISPQAGSVSSAMRSYKSAVSRMIRPFQPDFAWQTRFHDHVIRNTAEYERIEHYILRNIENWEQDKFFNKTA